MKRVVSEDERDEHDLAGEHDAPRQLGRGPAADDRPDRDARAGDAADHGIGGLAGGALEVPGDQRRHRGKHERGAESLRGRTIPEARTPTVGANAVIADPHA